MELFHNSLFSDANLVGYWRLEGNSNDSKGSNNGSDTAIIYGTAYGKYGQGALFNGSSSKITLGSLIQKTSNTDFSFTFWYKGTGNTEILLGWDNATFYSSINVNADGKLSYDHYDGTFKYIISTSTINDGNWHFCAIVNHSDQTMDLYVDAKQEKKAQSSIIDAGEYMKVNEFGHGYGDYLTGNMDDIAYFTKALTINEVNNLYGASFPYFL